MVEDNVGVALLYTGHAQLNNPLIHCVELKEYLPINQLLAWNGANENPNIAKCLEVMINR
ncbi:MAG: hypothetical protein MJ150_02045, partial [Clostridia bacterium]|nr:hypothetical protein [Clostridia bacterium]